MCANFCKGKIRGPAIVRMSWELHPFKRSERERLACTPDLQLSVEPSGPILDCTDALALAIQIIGASELRRQLSKLSPELMPLFICDKACLFHRLPLSTWNIYR